MNRIDRLFGILILLQSKKFVTAEKIAARFHISIRTVYRDIKALSEQGIPVNFEPNRGYCIMQGYFLQPVSFSTEEANALLLVEQMVQGFADRSISAHYSTALNKVRSVLREGQKENLDFLENNIRFQMPACLIPDQEYLSILQKAISGRTILDLEYRNNQNESSRRLVEPIGLVFYAFGWHLIGWCHKREDYRDFKVIRILKLKDTGQPFRKNMHMELGEYMKALPVPY